MPERDHESLPDDIVGGAVDLIPIVGSLLAPLAKRLSAAVRREHQRNVSVALDAATRVSGMSREDLEEAIAKDPALVPLLVRVLHAAGMNGHDKILKAMGIALGDAVRERNRINEAELILGSLSDLGPDHIAVLEVIEAPPSAEDNNRWGPASISRRLDSPITTVSICVSGLYARGLVDIGAGAFGGTLPHTLTELGRLVLAVLREVSLCEPGL